MFKQKTKLQTQTEREDAFKRRFVFLGEKVSNSNKNQKLE